MIGSQKGSFAFRLDALRQELRRRELYGFVLPISDERLSEYVGACAQRLAWLTGFGGSAGSAVVLLDKAAIFVDGRYTMQAREQVNNKLFECRSVPKDTIGGWIAANASEGSSPQLCQPCGSALGILPMIGKLLCHRHVTTNARYAHLDDGRVIEAEQRIGNLTEEMMGSNENAPKPT